MMKTKKQTSNLATYLNSLEGLQPAEPKDFFYSRLISRLEDEQPASHWIFPLKPAWMVSMLLFLIALNTFLFTQKRKSYRVDDPASIEGFAQAYDQQISTY